jgi:hypothetical protein
MAGATVRYSREVSDRKIHLLEKTINRYFQEIERTLFELWEGDGGETVIFARHTKKGGHFS